MSGARTLVAEGAGLLGCALVLLFFSEFLFFNESVALTFLDGGPTDRLRQLASLAGFYMLFTLPFLTAVRWFGIRSLSGLFLAGCLFGWATEGTVIPIVYENPPWSFLWPSVGWHVLVNVMVGLVVIPRVLAVPARWVAPLVFMALGIAWGYWSTWIWADGPGLSPEAFTGYVLWTFPLIPAGLGLLALTGRAIPRIGRRRGLVGSLVLVPFAILTAAPVPFWGLAFGALVTLVLAGLAIESRLPQTPPPPPLGPVRWHWAWLGAMPASAIWSYEVFHDAGVTGASELALPALFALGTVSLPAVLMLRVRAAASATRRGNVAETR